MILDAHTHVQDIPGSLWDSPPDRIIALMDKAGAEQAVIMTYSDATPEDESFLRYVADCVARFPKRLIGFARLDPSSGEGAAALLERALTKYGMRGLKLHPVGYRLLPSSEQTLEVIRVASRFRVPVLFHCGDEPYTLPLQIAEAARQCPEARIILGHMGGYFHVEDAIRAARRFPHIYLETSATPYPALIRKAVRELGARRVIFASDGPGCTPPLEVEKIRLAELTPDEERQVFSESFLRLLEEARF